MDINQPIALRDLLNAHQVQITEFGNQPHYNLSEDVIVMPQRQYFNQSQDYDITLLHELVHWAGRVDRLNRTCMRNYVASDAARAEEELVAEIGSVFLASYFGLMGDVVNHASYVASWKKYLDVKAVGRAVTQASQAFHWLISKL
jgi:antirestriction protein ArdC